MDVKLGADNSPDAVRMHRIAGNRVATEAGALRNTLRKWFTFYNSYDPMFTWWVEEGYRTVDSSLQSYAGFPRERVAGLRPTSADTAVVSAPVAGAAGVVVAGEGVTVAAVVLTTLRLPRRRPVLPTISWAILLAAKG